MGEQLNEPFPGDEVERGEEPSKFRIAREGAFRINDRHEVSTPSCAMVGNGWLIMVFLKIR